METAVEIGAFCQGLALILLIIAIGVLIWFLRRLLKYQHNRISELECKIENIYEHISKLERDVGKTTSYTIDENSKPKNNDVRPVSMPVIRPSSLKGPRYTFKIRKQTANCYGAEANVSQLISTAQKFYKDEKDSETHVPVDQIDITALSLRDRNDFKSLKRKSVLGGRPTSVLLDSTGNQCHDKGMFQYKVIGPSGGVIDISGVHLKIPPGALDTSVKITLGISWDETLQPELTQRQALLSPVILCQPSLTFNQPVTLMFPHCAADVSTNWKINIMKKEGNISDTSRWTAMYFDDAGTQTVTSSHISLAISHFTLYTCIGEGLDGKVAAKAVKMVAFTSTFEVGTAYKTRIYCVNDYGQELKDISDTEKHYLKGNMADAPASLLVHDNGENLVVTSSFLSENWKVKGNKSEEIYFEHVWHALTPSCTFIFEPQKRKIKEIHCDFESSQKGSSREKAKLKIADQFKQTMGISLEEIKDDPTEELIRQLCIYLDPISTSSETSGDYKMLADKLHCDISEVAWLGTQPNPTEHVVNKFLTDGGKMGDLEKILIEIKRPDAADLVKRHMEILHEIMTDTQ